MDAGSFGTYTLFQLEGKDVAGMMNPTAELPGSGSYWHSYFAVCAVSDPTGAVAHLMQPILSRA